MLFYIKQIFEFPCLLINVLLNHRQMSVVDQIIPLTGSTDLLQLVSNLLILGERSFSELCSLTLLMALSSAPTLQVKSCNKIANKIYCKHILLHPLFWEWKLFHLKMQVSSSFWKNNHVNNSIKRTFFYDYHLRLFLFRRYIWPIFRRRSVKLNFKELWDFPVSTFIEI